jgi:hypothetical protein
MCIYYSIQMEGRKHKHDTIIEENVSNKLYNALA